VPFLFSTAQKDKDAPQIFSKLTTYYMMVIIFVGLAISLFSGEIIHILTTPQFYEASKIVPIIVLSFVFIGMYMMMTNQIFYMKKTHYFIYISGIAATVNIVLNFILIPKYGIMGAAYTTLISFVLFFVLTYIISIKIYPILYEKKKIIYLFFLAFTLYFIGDESVRVVNSTMMSIFFKLLIVLSYPFLLLIFKYFNSNEKEMIINFLTNKR